MPSSVSRLWQVGLAAALLLTGPVAFAADDEFAVATFAGGCFWSMEAAFDEVEGVTSTTSGYTGASSFHAAPEGHQNYKEKNPVRYKRYRSNCGRDARLKELWGAQHSS